MINIENQLIIHAQINLNIYYIYINKMNILIIKNIDVVINGYNMIMHMKMLIIHLFKLVQIIVM